VTTALLIAAVGLAFACPLHMLWRMRRGRQPCCGQATRAERIEALRRHQEALAEEVRRQAAPATGRYADG
jgi:hypothetical protein